MTQRERPDHDLSMSTPATVDATERTTDARRWRLDTALAYDFPVGEWSKTYRTRIGALIAAQWNLRLASWGGWVTVTDTRTSAAKTYVR